MALLTQDRKFFEQQAVILISPEDKPIWVKSSNCLWVSTVQTLRTKYIVSPFYSKSKDLELFFRGNLDIRDLNAQDVTEALYAFSPSVYEGQDSLYLKDLLLAWSEFIKKTPKGSHRQLSDLKDKEVVPLFRIASNGEKIHRRVTMDDDQTLWYIPDSVAYRNAFQEKVWLADIEPEDSTKLEPLVKQMKTFFNRSKYNYLSKAIKHRHENGGIEGDLSGFTERLKNKAEAIAR